MQIEIEMTLTLMSGCQGGHLVSVIPLMSRYLHTDRPRSLFWSVLASATVRFFSSI